MKKHIDQQQMRESNTADIFGIIRKYGKLTRKQVAEKTNMSWGAVSGMTSQLIDDGYIVERKAESDGAAGRTPSYLEVNDGVHFSIGIDINTLGVRAVLMNLKREIVSFWEDDIELSNPQALIDSLFAFIDRVLNDTGKLHMLCIGIAMQGIVNAKKGVSVSMPGNSDWYDLPLSEAVEERFGIPTFVDHDPNCILYAASKQQNLGDTILVRADWGIGMAAMIGGKIIDKPGIFELGHTVVVPGGIQCGCGKRGCLGQYASIKGLSKLYGKSFEEFIADADRGCDKALSLLSDAADHLAFAISNAATLLNINNVILCGSLWNHKELFWDEFLSRVKMLCGNEDINFSFTGISSAPIGAAMIAEKSVLRRIGISKQENTSQLKGNI